MSTKTDQTDQLGHMRPWVEDQIAAGNYATEADAIQAGLVALAARQANIKNLQGLIQAGLDDVAAGRVHEYETPEAMIADIMSAK